MNQGLKSPLVVISVLHYMAKISNCPMAFERAFCYVMVRVGLSDPHGIELAYSLTLIHAWERIGLRVSSINHFSSFLAKT